jgi:hypothetical protein
MECMVAFSLALCALGQSWEMAVENDECRWCRIDEERAANGER